MLLNNPTAPILTNTDAAQEWLNQFLPEEKNTALSMLEHLHLVGRDEFERDLIEEFEAFLATAEQPVALFAVREVEEDEVYFSPDGPIAVGASHNVGSEGDIAHLIRDLRHKYDVLDHPSKTIMRTKKVRNIVLLNDSIASGDQVLTFAKKHIYGDPTIKSWTSSGKVKITAIVHSSTRTGSANVLRGNAHWSLRSAFMFGDLTEGLSREYAQRIKDLCLKYGRKNGIPDQWHLGYNKTFSGTIFPHKCPNTVPGLLWYSRQGNQKPLFGRRGSFDFPIWPTSINQAEQLQRVFVNAGQPSLASLEWVNSLGDGAPLKIAILALASRRVRVRSAMAERLRVSFVHLDQLLSECIEQHWLTRRGALTGNGRAILSAAKQLGFEKIEPEWPDPDLFFFLPDVGDHWRP